MFTNFSKRKSQIITFSQAPTATYLSEIPFSVTKTMLQSGWQTILKFFNGT